MSKYCPDFNCDFYDLCPNGTKKMKTPSCPCCQSPFIDEKPFPPDQLIEDLPIASDPSVEPEGDLLINDNAIMLPVSPLPSSPPTDEVIVTFYAAIQLSHLNNNKYAMSLQFHYSPLVELKLELLEFKSHEVRSYDGTTYALFTNSVNIPSKILDICGGNKAIIIPYTYYIDNQKEKHYADKPICFRSIVLSFSNFFPPNVINKYDTIILPPDLTQQERNNYKDLKRLLGLPFNLYIPKLQLSNEGRLLLSFAIIKDELKIVLCSLCDSLVICIRKSILSKNEYICSNLYQTKEERNEVMRDLLLGWVIALVQTDLPFHLKFYLSFLCPDEALMQLCAGELFCNLFDNIGSEYMLSVIRAEEERNLFLEYHTEIRASPQLLHCAMQRVSELDTDRLMLLLPLYHLLFNSEQDFGQTHSTHSFSDNAYWGLPAGIQFKHNPNIELSKIREVLSPFDTTDHMLPYSIILLYLRLDMFSQLLEILAIPFLPFFSVLLYRIDKWSLLKEDTQLRESVFNAFLTQTAQTPNLMNHGHICQASDVLFQVVQLIMSREDTLNNSFEEACLLLQVLGRLLCIFDRDNNSFSEHKFHLAQKELLSLVPSSVLITSIEHCVDAAAKLSRQPGCDGKCFHQVIVWNRLYCTKFPPSYGWVDSLSKEFSKRLERHSLPCLLSSIDKLFDASEIEISLSIFHDICLKLIHIGEKSQTPLRDHELIVQSLVEFPEIKFRIIIDVLAKIIVLHRLDIIGVNAVEHILSVSWYPLLFIRCSTHVLKCTAFPEAETLLTSCIEAIHKLDTDFHNLTITVNHLILVIKYKATFFQLLKSLPFTDEIVTRVMNESTFNSAVELLEAILDYFLNQLRLIGDLKRLLDSTNSGIYSTEVSEFLAIEYVSKSIFSLCTASGRSEFMLMPRNKEFNSFNRSPIKMMLGTLPLLLQSQLFKTRFKHSITSYLETEKFQLAITVDTIYTDHWLPSLQFVSVALSSLFNMKILLKSIDQHFGIYCNHPQEIKVEILNLVLVLQNFGHTYDQAQIDQSLDKVICYFRLKTVENIVKHILQIRDAYRFTRQFSIIDSISNLELNKADNELSIISPELLSTTDILSDLTELHLKILQTLLDCVSLFTWTAGVLQNSADLDNFTDLALNTVDSTCFNVNRITSFKEVCTAFMPFILELEEVDEDCFLEKLNLVYMNLRETNKAHGLLAMSRDCAKKNELEFWKEFIQSHTSVGGSIIYPLKHIMRNGKFILSTGENTRNINDILKLHVCSNASQTDQVYSLEALREMQSNIILITPLMHEDKDSPKCVAILEQVIILADLFLQMHNSGNIFFRKLTHKYKCQSIDRVKQDVSFLREECEKWTAQLAKARDEFYQLNFFTALQIVNIQVGLEGMGNGEDLDRDTFHLLTLIREHISQQDIEMAYRRFKSGSCSYQSPASSVYSSVSSTDTLPTSVCSDSVDLNSTSSQDSIQDSHSGVCEVSLGDIYKASKRNICSLEDVATFFKYLYCKNEIQNEMPSSFNVIEPNLIYVETSVLLIRVLSFYLQTGFRPAFPAYHEVLICSEHTTTEDVDIFWRRAINSPSSSEIFCLAFIENLRYEIAMQSVTSLKNHLQLKKEGSRFRLILLCSIGSEQSNYMANALVQYKRIHTQSTDTDSLKELVFTIINNIHGVSNESPYLPLQPSSIIDPDTSCVRIINSECAGSGKSLTVSRLVDEMKERAVVSADMCTTINLFESQGCEHKAATKLIDFPPYHSTYGRICHLDITATCHEELIPFLFKLLITGVICDEYGRIWRCSKRNYYVIEITLSSQSPELLNFLTLFPDWQCLDPRAALEYFKTQKELPIGTHITNFDQKEMYSTGYQRVFSCLNDSTSKRKSQIIEPNNPQFKNPVEVLDVLLKNCSIAKPSWSVLKHFIFFLNNQLVACDKNIYCNQMVSVDKSWKGLKTFLVDCMILMSRDFTTPSLKNCIENVPTDVVQGYCIEGRRKWEEKNHPFIFLNEDGHTMTFFGIYVTDKLDQLDAFNENKVIGSKVFPEDLYRTLKHNKADMEQDCSTWDRRKMISILSNVMNNSLTPWDDVDPCYVLTIDNLKKMLAIHMRFRCNIPVIVMGETGCGKTRLIDFMCKLQAMRRNIENLVVLRVHGETTRQDIIRSYEKALGLAQENIRHGVDTILFFDETNTSPMIGLIKEILCDRRIDGSPIPKDIRLQFIAACNPYREHTPEMKKKLASAGLGMITGDRMPREHFGDIPLRDLVYRVIPLPHSLLPLVWDFGQLNPETENAYITEIIITHFTGETLKQLGAFCSVISKILSAVQHYMRERRDECSFVSLRDVERAVRVMLWFYELIPKLHIDIIPTISLVTYSLILSLSVCYRAKLKDRTAFDTIFIASLESPLSTITDARIISKEIDRFQTRLVNLMRIPNHVARNTALKENLFMMYVCIQLKIPLLIIGKPGSSKSLARSIINHSINEGILVEGKKIAEYTRVYMQCYQCSQYTTSKEISALFDKCQTIQKESAADSVACVVLDEVGLAEDSPNLPLKVLHSLLENSANCEFVRRRPNVAFVGLSNWALDPAKMNRSIMVQLEEPTTEDLVNTAHAIIKPSGQVDDVISERLSPYVRSLAEGYLELSLLQNSLLSREYFGLRDFYSLMKMLYSLCKQYNTRLNRRIMIHALKRNLGGITKINVLEVFHRCLIGLDDNRIGPLSDPLSLIRASLEPLAYESALERSRYFLLLTENYVAIDILFQSKIINKDTVVMFGSSFPLDRDSFNICHNINSIKIHMELGHVVVLTNLSNLYESLYELLNQFYVKLLGKYWVTIGIGSQRVECPVDPNFRLIVVADEASVYEQFPHPLINRLEKHFLTNSIILSDDPVVKEIARKLSIWIDGYVSIIDGAQIYEPYECFVGFQGDTPSFVVYSTISKLGFKGIEREKENVILEMCKNELIKLASPDSILRLPSSKLSSEADSISDIYFSFNLFSLSHYLQQLFKHRTHTFDGFPNTKSSPIFSFITTRSQLLTETDISELVINLINFSCHISNLYLSQFKTEKEFVSCILEEISFIPTHRFDTKIVIIQCTDANTDFDLISCAKAKVIESVGEMPNLCFLFIVRLSVTKHKSSFAGFCGIPWDSVHIDELRPPLHNLLPPLNVIKQTSVADIFELQFQNQERISNSLTEELNYSKRTRLLNCVQAAASRLTVPSGPTEQRNAERIRLLACLLSEEYKDLAEILCGKISHLLRQITLPEYSNTWSLFCSLRADNRTRYPTVMKALSQYIDSVIEPLLAGLLGAIDVHNNLDLAFSKETVIKKLWKILFEDDSLFDFRSLISPEILSYSKYINMDYAINIRGFTSKFPFFLHVYQYVTRLYKELNMNIGNFENGKRFMDIFYETSVGKAILSTDVTSKSNLHYKYLESLVGLQNDDQLSKVIYVMIAGAISSYQRDLMKEESTTESVVDREVLQEISIPLIHIAHEMIRNRIAFVKEALYLGFILSTDLSTRLDSAIKRPKECCQLINIDFEIFKSIIQRSLKIVSKFLENTDARKDINFVYTCQYLIEENMYLFYRDFSRELVSLRCSLYLTQTVMLFDTNIIRADELKGLSNAPKMIKTSIGILQEVIFQKDVSFQSLQTFKGILRILVDMDKQLRKYNGDNDLSSIGLTSRSYSYRKATITSFQIKMTRFFQQFISRIIFAGIPSVPEDLFNTMIPFCLNKDLRKFENIFGLFQESDIYTPDLRCTILQLMFRGKLGRVWQHLEPEMVDIYRKVADPSYCLTVKIVLQNLENAHIQRLNEHLTTDEKLHYIYDLLQEESLYHPLRRTTSVVSYHLLESVAVLRFCITWLVKWYSATEFRTIYIHSQVTTAQTKKNTSNHVLERCFYVLDKNIKKYSLHDTALLFLLKTLYFRTGLGDILSHSRCKDFMLKVLNESEEHLNSYIDMFYGFDPTYEDMLKSLSKGERSINNMKKKMSRNDFDRSLFFAIFSKLFAYHMSGVESELGKDSKREPSPGLDSIATIQNRTQLLSPALRALADGISQNRFLNMSQFHISQDTHLNTVLIAGLLCHIAVFLLYSDRNEFLRPLTLIHYEPSALKGKYLPAIPHDIQSVPRHTPDERYSKTIQSPKLKAPECFRSASLHDVEQNYKIHFLGDPLERTSVPTGIRRLSALSVALLRSIMHCIFTYTLQTEHLLCPTKVTQLVELRGSYTYSEYFFLHLIQDIIDVTTITNKTFEEAVLIIHTLINQLIDKRITSPTDLRTKDNLEEWENIFEKNYVIQLEALDDQLLGKMMKRILTKSQQLDIKLLRKFYEEGETDFACMLWRHRTIVGYDHLLQVFSCQFSYTEYPLLDKFLKEEPLLSLTRYIPEFVSLQAKLVQKSMHYYKEKNVKDLYISEFLEFIQKVESSGYEEHLREFTSLRIACMQLAKERSRLQACYSQTFAINAITNDNTRIRQLLTTSHQSAGILTSLTQLLVEIHNSFISKYRETILEKQMRSKSTIPLSLVTSHHLISYQAHLDILIFSNVSQSFLMGEGRLVEYDFRGIENEFVNRFMLNKLSIKDDLKVDHSEGSLLNKIRRLQFNIPQEKLIEDNWNFIKAELMDPHDISEVLSLLELVINFASFGKERPQRPIKSYMYEVLKYPDSKCLISYEADEMCSLKHLLSLWHNLSIQRTKLDFHQFTHVPSCYAIGLNTTQISDLMVGFYNRTVNDILPILYDFILFNMCEQQDQSTLPNDKLHDSLALFSNSNLFLTQGNPINYKLIPDSILVSHTLGTWTQLISFSKTIYT